MTSAMPAPQSPVDVARWAEQALRLRLLTGCWDEDALQREADFFAPEVRAMLPPAETSRNAFKSCIEQIAILYDDEWLVAAAGVEADALAPVVTPSLLPLNQERHRTERGLNECFMRLDWEEGDTEVQYRVVPPCFVAGVVLDRKRNVIRLEELRPRNMGDVEVWTWETWDARDSAAPEWRIEIEKDGKRIDVTAEYAKPGFPYHDKSGKPIVPYVLAHARVGNHTFDCRSGHELVIGTLTASVLWTFWIGGVRDGAHPQRAVIDGVVEVTGAVNGQNVVRMNPQTILQIASRKIGEEVMHAAIAQWQPAMDPATAGKAIQDFEAGLCVSAGLSPADVSGGSNGQSGYAIVVSRDGLRRYQRKAIPPARLADTQILVMAAKLANAYGGHSLPEEQKAWSIQYAPIQKAPDEIRAETEQAEKYISMKLMSRVQAAMKLFGLQHPAAEEWIAEVDEAETKPETVVSEGDSVVASSNEVLPPVVSEDAGLAVKASDTALNGAQVQAAAAIIGQVAARLLPRESGVQQLVEFFNIDSARADRIMGPVGKTFFIEPQPQ